MGVLLAEARNALRSLRNAPGFTATVVATLALGIGLNAAIFTAVDCVLLRPLGLKDADRIVALETHFTDENRSTPRLGGDDYRDVAQQVKGLASAAYYMHFADGVGVDGSSVYLPAAMVSPQFAEVLGVQPVAGRLFHAADTSGTDVLASAGFARDHFGSAEAALGHTITYTGAIYTVAGVLPDGFSFPEKTELWFESQATPRIAPRSAYNQQAVGKRRADVSPAALDAELRTFSAGLQRTYPEDRNKAIEAVPLQQQIVGPIRPTLHLLSGAVALVLPAALLSFDEPHLDPVTLSVTITVSIAAGVLCALVPAFELGRLSVLNGAFSAAPGRTVSGRTHRFGQGFATAQVALALVLLTLAAGLLEQFYRLLHTPLGYQPEHVISTSVHFPFGSDPAKVHRFVEQFEQRIGSLPGVASAGAIDALPLSPFMVQWKADIFGQPSTAQHDAVTAEARQITPGYLRAMQIPLLAGRSLEARDSEPGAPPVVLVNQTLAQKYFPRGNAVGQRFVRKVGADSGPRSSLVSAEIVGVVGNVQGTGGDLGAPVAPEVDAPEKGNWPDMHFVLETSLPPASLEPTLRSALASLEPGAALGPVEPLASSLDRALAEPRLNGALLAALAALALLLVLIGVYGVVAFSVAERTRELAVRLALGSPRAAIYRMLVLEAAQVVGLGLVLGIAGALAAGRILAAVGVSAASAGNSVFLNTIALCSTLLAIAVLGASSIPARRATTIDPMQVLRSE